LIIPLPFAFIIHLASFPIIHLTAIAGSMRSFIVSLAVAGLANAHGYFADPPARQPGNAYKAACGEQAYNMMSSDINGNIQGLQQLTSNQADFDAEKCGLWLCKVS
jgi:predicted carbohydrate-binding protein with CBM5 and CBM33 domain